MIDFTRWKDVRAASADVARATMLRNKLCEQVASLAISAAVDHPDWRDADTRARWEGIERDLRDMTERRLERMIAHLDAAIAGNA